MNTSSNDITASGAPVGTRVASQRRSVPVVGFRVVRPRQSDNNRNRETSDPPQRPGREYKSKRTTLNSTREIILDYRDYRNYNPPGRRSRSGGRRIESGDLSSSVPSLGSYSINPTNDDLERSLNFPFAHLDAPPIQRDDPQTRRLNRSLSQEAAKRDQERIHCAIRSKFLNDRSPQSMMRRRKATGEEVVVAEGLAEEDNSQNPWEPVLSPEAPSSPASLTGLSTDSLTKRTSITSIRDSAGKENPVEEKEKGQRPNRTRSRLPASTKSIPGKEKNGEIVIGAGSPSPDLKSPDEMKRTGPKPGTMRSVSINYKINGGTESRPEPFQTVQRRVEERSTRTLPKESPKEPTAATTASIERRRTMTALIGDRPSSRQSRIPTPTAMSPGWSRPTSSQDRRPASLISSSERRPLRSPSSASMRSRTSDPASPTRRDSTRHIRMESNPNPVSREKEPFRHQSRYSYHSHDFPTPERPPNMLQRADSAPDQYSGAADDHGTPSPTPSFEIIQSSEYAMPSTTDDSIDSKETVKGSPGSRNPGNTSDSFLIGLTNNMKADEKLISPDYPPAHKKTTDAGNEKPKSPKLQKRPAPLNDFANFIEDKSPRGGPSTESPLYDRSTGRPKAFPKKPETALNGYDGDLDGLEDMMENDRKLEALLNPPLHEDEDDTFSLLGGSKQYEPQALQIVRPKTEAMAADRSREREKADQNKLITRLKTLQLELRSARRGIANIERQLQGQGSSDEGEWVDDEDIDDGDLEEIFGRKRRYKPPHVQPAEEAKPQLKTITIDPPQPIEPSVQSKVVSWIIFILKLALIWVLLELWFLSVCSRSSSIVFPFKLTIKHLVTKRFLLPFRQHL
jgi:hypothetical protein